MGGASGAILALYDAATLTHAAGQLGTTSASLIATHRYVFVVPHDARVVPLLLPYLPGPQAVGPSPDQLRNALQTMLADPNTRADQVESWLASNLAPAQVLQLAALKTYKVETSALSRGFYYKTAGSFTWDCVVLEAGPAQQLAAFLPSPDASKAASPEVAAMPPALREVPGARGKGALHLLVGLLIYAGGLAVAVTLAPGVVIFSAVLAPVLVLGGLFRLVKGQQVDERTGQPWGGWQSGFTIALVVGAFLGLGLIYPSMLLGQTLYQQIHAADRGDEGGTAGDDATPGSDDQKGSKPGRDRKRRRR